MFKKKNATTTKTELNMNIHKTMRIPDDIFRTKIVICDGESKNPM